MDNKDCYELEEMKFEPDADFINKPVLKRNEELERLENGAFDIPNIKTSMAIDYFSGKIPMSEVRRKFINELYDYRVLHDEDIKWELKQALIGKERFFEVIDENMDENVVRTKQIHKKR